MKWGGIAGLFLGWRPDGRTVAGTGSWLHGERTSLPRRRQAFRRISRCQYRLRSSSRHRFDAGLAGEIGFDALNASRSGRHVDSEHPWSISRFGLASQERYLPNPIQPSRTSQFTMKTPRSNLRGDHSLFVFASFLVLSQLASAESYRCVVGVKVTLQQSPCPTLATPPLASDPVSQPQDKLREAAEARRVRQARIREENEKGFQNPGPDRPRSDFVVSRIVPGTSLTQGQICRAAIGAIMAQSPTIIKLDRETGGVTYVHYVRPTDRSPWSYKCSVNGRTVSWANADGRWRNLEADGVVSFIKVDNAIAIRQRFSDGSLNTVQFLDASL